MKHKLDEKTARKTAQKIAHKMKNLTEEQIAANRRAAARVPRNPDGSIDMEQAIADGEEMRREHIEARKRGRPVGPPTKARSIRLTVDLWEQAEEKAQANGQSLNAWVAGLVQRSIG
jgi:hypothetical protein